MKGETLERKTRKMSIEEIQKLLEKELPNTEQVFWIGTTGKRGEYGAELIFYTPDFPVWLMKTCNGDKKQIIKELNEMFKYMEMQILDSLDISTEEDRQRNGVRYLPMGMPTNHDFED